MTDNLQENIPTNHISPGGEMGQGEVSGIQTFSPIMTRIKMMRRKKNINTDVDHIKQNIKEDALDQELVKLFSEFEAPDLLVEAAEKVSRTVKGPKSDRNVEHLKNLRMQAIERSKARHGGKLPHPRWSKDTIEVARQDHEKAVQNSKANAFEKHAQAAGHYSKTPFASLNHEKAFDAHLLQYTMTGDPEHRKAAFGHHVALMQHANKELAGGSQEFYQQGTDRAYHRRRERARMAGIEIADRAHGYAPPKKPGFFGKLKKRIFGEDIEIEDSIVALLLIEEIDNILANEIVNEQIVMKVRKKFIR